MSYQSINPFNSDLIKEYPLLTDEELGQILQNASLAYLHWRNSALMHRAEIIAEAGNILRKNKLFHARMISVEMGKPIRESIAEVEKCVLLCDYFAQNAEKMLAEENFSDSHHTSLVFYEPSGIILAVMPWNFPYWQVFRFLVPNLVLGNAALLKHASNVPGCALAIEKLLLESGLPEGVFKNLFISHGQAEKVIEYKDVQGVTVTGSEYAGSVIAGLAGKNIKKTVLELGGSDPFIVLKDANIELAVQTGIQARMRNAGQSCIAAKRFIIHEDVYDRFSQLFCEKAASLKLGDPLDEHTEMGPLARDYLLNDLEQQVEKSVALGAKILTGGSRSHAGKLFYQPTVLTDIIPGMPAYNEELFGPVAAFFRFSTMEEAIQLANDTEFGLGASVWTSDASVAKEIARQIESGIIAINGLVASEPHIPFGGIKKSGYGRELSHLGLREFANIKTVNIF